jgi:hypothetical protein
VYFFNYSTWTGRPGLYVSAQPKKILQSCVLKLHSFSLRICMCAQNTDEMALDLNCSGDSVRLPRKR